MLAVRQMRLSKFECRWLGVDKISITENTVHVTRNISERLAPYIASGLVDLDAWGSDTAAQLPAFRKCFGRLKDSHDWVAFFDTDEYLMLLERCVGAPGRSQMLQDIVARARTQ